jgi:DNA-binding MarR family transcriptional regulator
VGELAERLQMKHHGVVALLTRCEESGLIRRQQSSVDRRQVEVHLTASGGQYLQRLAARHEAELHSLQDTFQVVNITAFNDNTRSDQAHEQ